MDGHLFVITTGGPPSVDRAEQVFREHRGTNGNPKTRARHETDPALAAHSFAVRSLENLDPGADPSRHMLALATYLGHANASHTLLVTWNQPQSSCAVSAEDAEQAHMNGGSDD